MLRILSSKIETFDFSSVQLKTPSNLRHTILAWTHENISRSDLFLGDDGDLGYEDDPHITAKYGLHTNNVDDVRKIVQGFGSFDITLGGISKFESDDYDVIKIDVESEKLHELNALISDSLKCTDTHATYIPHLTLAYVQPDSCNSLLKNKHFAGKGWTVDCVEFSPVEGEKEIIFL